MYKRENIEGYVSTTTESLLFYILEELTEMNKLLRGDVEIPEPDAGKELSAQKCYFKSAAIRFYNVSLYYLARYCIV